MKSDNCQKPLVRFSANAADTQHNGQINLAEVVSATCGKLLCFIVCVIVCTLSSPLRQLYSVSTIHVQPPLTALLQIQQQQSWASETKDV